MTTNADTRERLRTPIRARIPIRAPIALAAIVVVYLALGVLYATLTPPWQVPDEPAHYNYVRHLVEERRLPVLQQGDYDQAYLSEIVDQKFDPAYPIDSIRYEYHQPPLYYLLLAPVYALSGGALLPLRLTSVLLGAGVVIVAYLVVHKAYPSRTGLALGTAAFLAFIPQHIAMNAGVQNDPLAELILGLVLLRLVSWLRSDTAWTTRQHAVTGVIIGLGLLTKLSAYVAVPLALVAVVLKYSGSYPRRGRTSERERGFEGRGLDVQAALAALAALLLPALLLGLPWFVRNAVVYGSLDFTGLGRHAEVVQGQLTTAQWIARYGWRQLPGAFVRTTFRSFWGQFGWMAVPMEWRVYLALRVFSIFAGVGLVFRLVDAWDAGRRPSASLLLLLCSGILTLGSYLWYNLSFYQAQGRYLFPALIPIGLAWTLGLEESLRRRTAPWLAGVLALVTAYDLFKILRGAGNKWAVLIHGAGMAYVGAGWVLTTRFRAWLLSAPYLFLVAVCAVSPFWFIVPNLSP
ncbi:MAG TPA: DUF2142 domain-containing protein [Anaerolineae bacterium]|nr:DUF2142 domain-containing protein [Anaerolineae bacterium]